MDPTPTHASTGGTETRPTMISHAVEDTAAPKGYSPGVTLPLTLSDPTAGITTLGTTRGPNNRVERRGRQRGRWWEGGRGGGGGGREADAPDN